VEENFKEIMETIHATLGKFKSRRQAWAA